MCIKRHFMEYVRVHIYIQGKLCSNLTSVGLAQDDPNYLHLIGDLVGV